MRMTFKGVATAIGVATLLAGASAQAQDNSRYRPYGPEATRDIGPQSRSYYAPDWPMDEATLSSMCGIVRQDDRSMTFECQPDAMDRIQAMGPRGVDPSSVVCVFNGTTRYNQYSPIVGRYTCNKNSRYVDPNSGYQDRNGPYRGSRFDTIPYGTDGNHNDRDRRDDRGRRRNRSERQLNQ